ncbi:MAG: hypothetical protein F9K44_02210 [Hyphomicrobiaceae bacterium]|nr:MAG: hypothetical protein F9K44_02210 [Hyphomicrobiaceae bacterium]
MMKRVRVLAMAMAVALVAAWPVCAGQLEPAACDKAKADQAALISAGVKEDMAKGPEWAAKNLSPERIARIKSYLSLEEDIRFRCPQPKPPRPEKVPASKEAAEKTPEAKPVKPATRVKKETPPKKRRAIHTQTKPIEPATREQARPPASLDEQAKDIDKRRKNDGEGDQ